MGSYFLGLASRNSIISKPSVLVEYVEIWVFACCCRRRSALACYCQDVAQAGLSRIEENPRRVSASMQSDFC